MNFFDKKEKRKKKKLFSKNKKKQSRGGVSSPLVGRGGASPSIQNPGEVTGVLGWRKPPFGHS